MMPYLLSAALLSSPPQPRFAGESGYLIYQSNFLPAKVRYTYAIGSAQIVEVYGNLADGWSLAGTQRCFLWTNAAGGRWPGQLAPPFQIYTQSTAGFHPASLDHHCHTQNAAAATGRTNWIYAVHTHTHSTGSGEFYTNPAALPIFERQSNSVIRLWRGHTGISHCNTVPGGAWGQLGMTLITRRHAYLRGHDTGRDPSRPTGDIYTNYAGCRVFFCTESNTVVAMTISNRTVRAWVGNDNDDFGLVIFTEDVPDSITPVKVVRYWDMRGTSTNPGGRAMVREPEDDGRSGGIVPVVDWWVSQDGSVGQTGPPLPNAQWVAPIRNPYNPRSGDSGGAMFLVISNEICVFRGLTTYGYEHVTNLLTDLNTLTLSLGLDTNQYQPAYVTVTNWPFYSRYP